MALSLRLDVKQTQSLVLTPQLQQAIRLLQLSSQELSSEIQRELLENPFLTASGPAVDAPPKAKTEREIRLDGTPGLAPSARERGEPGEWDAPPQSAATDQRLRIDNRSSSGAFDNAGDPMERLTSKPDLRSHLREQLSAARASERVLAIARLLTDWIEDDGYLREDDRTMADQLDVDLSEVTAARALLQQCDPIGVAARDLRECLALQLRDLDRLDPAMEKLLDRLPVLAQADWNALIRACQVDRDDLEDMVREIKALDPRPGTSFSAESTDAIIPDLIVFRSGEGLWRIELNAAAQPRIAVDGDYHAEIGNCDLDRDAKAFVSERLQSAGWLVKALEQRSRTILKVAKCIFSHQREFLEKGPSALRPLVLREIAEKSGLHESTVSRATTEKYVQTPHGTLGLKYFFSTAIQSTTGGTDHSAEAIREKIKQLIRKETIDNVLSDDQVVDILKSDGVAIARRTVAKYREALGIPSSIQRRRSRTLAG
ncbi:MAG: RNA polymerase factor sigma-54 [Geminicoccaceae bacterium]|nr:RNA polymerase factor sigma-54 [Geminicoccaceae bacterium]